MLKLGLTNEELAVVVGAFLSAGNFSQTVISEARFSFFWPYPAASVGSSHSFFVEDTSPGGASYINDSAPPLVCVCVCVCVYIYVCVCVVVCISRMLVWRCPDMMITPVAMKTVALSLRIGKKTPFHEGPCQPFCRRDSAAARALSPVILRLSSFIFLITATLEMQGFRCRRPSRMK